MTNEECIKMLKSKLDGNTDTSYEWCECVRLAIKALEQQPCEDCISREEAKVSIQRKIDELVSEDGSYDCGIKPYINGLFTAKIAISSYNLPSVAPQPVDCSEQGSPYCLGHCPYEPQPKRGKWIRANGDYGCTIWKCDQCGCEIYSETEHDRKKFHAWCGKCGCRMDADMIESEDEE